MLNDYKLKLKDIIATQSFSTGDAITLASGKSSHFYFNMKFTTLDPFGSFYISHLILDFLQQKNIRYFGGLEVGAIPMAASVSALSAETKHPIQAFFIRKKEKQHGESVAIEGIRDSHILKDVPVIVAEDVTTTGHSAMQAVHALQSVGAKVETVLTIIDRQEGAIEFFAEQNITLHALFKADEFMPPKL